jgi:hypothetical protein
VEFSIRDDKPAPAILRSQKGQAITEYILILVAVIGIILGGLYQLNSAFKTWANNYFGNYLACLLETGELPAISGSGGDSGICAQLFEPFSWEKGRPLLATGKDDSGGSKGGSTAGTREQSRSRAGGYSPAGHVGRFGGQFGRGGSGGARSKLKGASSDSDQGKGIGNMNYGKTYSSKVSGRRNEGVRYRLDNQFAFEDEKEKPQKRKAASAARKSDEGGRRPRILLRKKDFKSTLQESDDEPMSFAGFIRLLIIAAIIIALVMFLGGQMLQIGKSMER